MEDNDEEDVAESLVSLLPAEAAGRLYISYGADGDDANNVADDGNTCTLSLCDSNNRSLPSSTYLAFSLLIFNSVNKRSNAAVVDNGSAPVSSE
jgi:hypothetical protein